MDISSQFIMLCKNGQSNCNPIKTCLSIKTDRTHKEKVKTSKRIQRGTELEKLHTDDGMLHSSPSCPGVQ